ncbi:MAG: phytanoyl-CoA dioxygenase family protein [Gammaproteobacteria bacterium]|nr:phytanoyl-CoA dioxygenase family protein [Gammaproteobacteria bacterium]
MLTNEQVAQYQRDGFLVIRSVLDDHEIDTFETAFGRQNPNHGPTPGTYPDPGRYTLAKSCMYDPDLAFVVEHPGIVEPARALLNDDPVLTAFVAYDRTPGGPGIPMHNDYKRWRPVGSSMNWLFTIVPADDFDEHTGQLFLSPGSHHLDRIHDHGGRALDVDAAIRPDEDSFIDPELKRGDLCLMNMHCWHKAAPNKSNRHRIGFFNKYAAASHPPATGYYMFTDAAYDALSEDGKKLIAVHSDKPIVMTRLLLQRQGESGPEFLFLNDNLKGDDRLVFPGGPAWNERAIPDWDLGNYIAPMQHHIREQLKIETPWATYVGDFEEQDYLCRLYAYEMNEQGFPVRFGGEWVKFDDLRERRTAFGYEIGAIDDWLAPGVVRGKALSQAQSRVDQYAY